MKEADIAEQPRERDEIGQPAFAERARTFGGASRWRRAVGVLLRE
jgi:hypothetical protein